VLGRFDSAPRFQVLSPQVEVPMFLHTENGRVVSRQYCEGRAQFENILRARLEQLDPFVKNGVPIAWIDEFTFSYGVRK
jgi:hypothetical protein